MCGTPSHFYIFDGGALNARQFAKRKASRRENSTGARALTFQGPDEGLPELGLLRRRLISADYIKMIFKHGGWFRLLVRPLKLNQR